jgi:lysine-N-methylase
MPFPVRHLSVVQNWDCHVCGSCCKEYVVKITDEERRRIQAQDWSGDPVVEGRPLFRKSGPPWARHYELNQREDNSCVFLSEAGRCRIHERFGYESKPLPCRMFPFILVPAGDHWRVSMRFACPSAAGNKGRPLSGHEEALRQFAAELARREGLDERPGAALIQPARLAGKQRLAWPELLTLVRALSSLLRNREDRMERRIRKGLAWMALVRQARLDRIPGKKLSEFLSIVGASLDGGAPLDPASLPSPSWVGRVLFRQALGIFLRRDRGPERGIAHLGRAALLGAAWRFARGAGPVPRVHNLLPDSTFEEMERRPSRLTGHAEEVLERFYTIKTEGLQFFGPANFNLPFWEGLEMLLVTFPVLLWTARSWPELEPGQAVMRALTIVDYHFGYNPILSTRRQRFSFRLLASSGELARLIGHYALADSR